MKDLDMDDVLKFDSTKTTSVEVAVDGNILPLKIGDKIDIGDGIIRVVMKMQVNEDGRVTYGIQWLDGIDFKLDWFSYPEICHMNEIIRRKPKVGI